MGWKPSITLNIGLLVRPFSTPEGNARIRHRRGRDHIYRGAARNDFYHYRFRAVSATGTSTGSEQAFATPGPVEAVTNAASGVTVTVATLNGTANPRGYDAKYHFEYGKTTSYGTPTAEGDAGAGTSPVPEHANLVGCCPARPTTTALWRPAEALPVMVPTRTLGRKYDESELVSSRSAVRNPATGEEWVFYVNSESLVSQWYWNGKTWANSRLGAGGPAVEANSTPSAVYNATNGHIGVYYVGASGHLWSYSGLRKQNGPRSN